MEEQMVDTTDGTTSAATMEPVTPPTTTKGWKFGLQVVLAILLAVAMIAYIGYITYVRAYVVVGRAVVQTAAHDSARIKFLSDDQKTEVVAELAGSDKLQEFRVATKALGSEEGRDLSVKGRFEETNGYLQADYSRPEEITVFLKGVYPNIDKTKTYAMVSPLWQGQKWLHFEIPKSEKKEDVEWKWDDKDEQRMAWDWFRAVKPGKIVKNFPYQGEQYTKVTFGFRKEQLIDAINGMKDLDIDVKVSQINAMVKMVKSSDDWDKELFTVLIDQEGDLRVVMMQMPKIEEKYLDETIAESTTEGEANPVTSSVTNGIKNLIWQQEGEMVQLGTLTLDMFDEVKAAERPTEIVEATEVLATAQTELGPIIAQLMGGGAAAPKAPSTVKPSSAKTPTSVSCIQYKIREGEFASDKCYTKADYNDLMYYLQRYSAVAGAYNGEVAQANITCGGQSEMFKQSCEESKVAMQEYESEMQNYANTIRGIIAKGR